MKDLRSLLVEMSSSWLKRRKARAPDNLKTVDVNTVKPAPRLAERTTRQRPAHKPKPRSARDVASNM